MTSKSPYHISLFTGAGGLDIGLTNAGFETRLCVEHDKDCQATLRQNMGRFGYSELPILGDITKLSPGYILEQSGLKKGEACLVSGGPPCQAFSTAGKRGSINDPRGRLFLDFVSTVDAFRPRFFLMENVRGLRSAALRHRPLSQRNNGHEPLAEDEELGSLLKFGVLPEFDRIGYQVVFGILNALDYGSAQDRKRIIFIGSRDRELSPNGTSNVTMEDIIKQTHHKDGLNGRLRPKTLNDVIGALQDEPGEYMSYSPSRKAVYQRIPAGKNWRYIRDSDEFTGDELVNFMGGAYFSTGGRVGFWRRLSFEKWSPTLTTSPVQKATGLCHPTQTRPLSIKEYARIQGFPDDWEFSGSLASRYRQIGNAVPVELGFAVGHAIKTLMQQG